MPSAAQPVGVARRRDVASVEIDVDVACDARPKLLVIGGSPYPAILSNKRVGVKSQTVGRRVKLHLQPIRRVAVSPLAARRCHPRSYQFPTKTNPPPAIPRPKTPRGKPRKQRGERGGEAQCVWYPRTAMGYLSTTFGAPQVV